VIGRNSIRVVLVHNFYRQPGGEDRVFATEAQVLRERGHQVFTYSRRNPKEGGAAVLRLCGQAFWNQSAYLDLRSLIRNVRPDVVHLHNTFPLISPAACYAARREGIAVVQTLHNYRLLCPNGLFFRDGRPCEDCIDRPVPWPAVLHACYRNSYAASIVAGGTLAAHRALGTWATHVDRYIALTEFARQKFIAGGLAADRIVLKPNMVHPDPGLGSGDGRFALFVGRLSHEKGVETLLAAWRRVANLLPLTIVGDGPLQADVRCAVSENPAISWLGQRSPEEVQALLGRATCLVVPSLWYETFGLVVAEAFARGTPVVASKRGALAELVEHGRTGLHFVPGNPDDLARQVEWISGNPASMNAMRESARSEYERLYSVGSNYPALCQIYQDAIDAANRGGE
jgi:glycosyltransferase involved in cell wall biosynthesis